MECIYDISEKEKIQLLGKHFFDNNYGNIKIIILKIIFIYKVLIN